MPLRLLPCRPAPALVLALSMGLVVGCTAFERGAEQGEPRVHPVTGCPDLSGRFRFSSTDADGEPDRAIDPQYRADVNSGLFTPKVDRDSGPDPLSRYEGVVIEMRDTHGMALRFLRPHSEVMADLERIRENERPRYDAWYALLQPSTLGTAAAAGGAEARIAKLRDLGPPTGVSVTLFRNRDYTCDDGWMLLPREHRQPVRLTLDPQGHLVFESKEFTTMAFGGWGDQSFNVPTGAYLGTDRWRREADLREWDADEVASRFVFARPAGEIEAEQAEFAENNRRNAIRMFAAPEDVRAALQPLLPEGLALADIEITNLPFKGPRVRLHVAPADAALDGEEQRKRLEAFLAALKKDDPGYIEDGEVVKRVISNSGRLRYEFEIFLDTHPAVQPPRERITVAFTPAPASTTLPVSPPTTAALPMPAPLPAPPGFAGLDVVEARLQPLLVAGCRALQLRYAPDAVIVAGRADDMPCVSGTLRAIDGVISGSGGRVELLQINADDEGTYRFEIRVPLSPLTRA